MLMERVGTQLVADECLEVELAEAWGRRRTEADLVCSAVGFRECVGG